MIGPTNLWFNNELLTSALVLLGNGDINIEGKQLKINKLNVKPWIFWPHKPIVYENFIDKNRRKLYKERTNNTIFIGNTKNETLKPVQKYKY